jgi:hypothetical protein
VDLGEEFPIAPYHVAVIGASVIEIALGLIPSARC